MFIYSCDVCKFEQWDYEARPRLKCNCGQYVNHIELEGDGQNDID